MADMVVGGIRRASGWSMALGVLIVVLGIIATMTPFVGGIVAVYILGWSAIFGGAAHVLFAFRTHSGGSALLEVVLGLIYVIAGFYVLANPIGGLLTLTLLLGCMLAVYGLVAIVLSFRLRPSEGWGWMLFNAIVTLIVGIMISARWPINSVWVIGTLFGFSMIFSGISRFMISLGIRKLATASTV